MVNDLGSTMFINFKGGSAMVQPSRENTNIYYIYFIYYIIIYTDQKIGTLIIRLININHDCSVLTRYAVPRIIHNVPPAEKSSKRCTYCINR